MRHSALKIAPIMNSLSDVFANTAERGWLPNATSLPGDGSASASQGIRSVDCCHTCHISDMRGTKASVVCIIYMATFPCQVQVSAKLNRARALSSLDCLSAGFETDMVR